MDIFYDISLWLAAYAALLQTVSLALQLKSH